MQNLDKLLRVKNSYDLSGRGKANAGRMTWLLRKARNMSQGRIRNHMNS